MRIVRSLPAYARTTQRVTQSAIEVRRAILEARAPDELLFDLLPRACGLAPITPDPSPTDEEVEAFFVALRAALRELQQAYAQLVHDVVSIFDARLAALQQAATYCATNS